MDKVVEEKLSNYKKKYHINKALRGLLISLLFILIIGIVAISLETIWWFSGTIRGYLFFSVLFVSFFLLVYLTGNHLLSLIQLKKRGIDDFLAAKKIGEHFSEINDKLLNVLQLENVSSSDRSLILASIEQKTKELSPFSFNEAIQFKQNRKYGRYLLLLVSFIALSSIAIPNWIPNSTNRVINYQTDFTPSAPFTFTVDYNKEVFRNDELIVDVELDGTDIPENTYIISSGRRMKLKKESLTRHSFEFKKVSDNMSFQIEGAGFRSKVFQINVLDRPQVENIEMQLNFPKHTGLDNRSFNNIRSVVVPEGTVINWLVNTQYTTKATIQSSIGALYPVEEDDKVYRFQKEIVESFDYQLAIENQYGNSGQEMNYEVDVVKDQFPQIDVEFYPDTVLYEFVIVSGSVSDDYGIISIDSYLKSGELERVENLFQGNQSKNSFYHRVDIDSTYFGNPLEIWVSAADNDRVNGLKTTKSRVFKLNFPDANKIAENIQQKSQAAENSIEKSIEESQRINDKLDELEQRLRSKKQLEWQEEKMLQEILKQRSEIEKSLQELRKQFEDLNESENKFNDRSQQIREKAAQLQELMNEVLDEETRKMYEELEKLINEKSDLQEIQNQIQNLRPNEKNMEQELERALELFKRLKLESELEKASKEFEKLGEEQENLAEKTTDEEQSTEELLEEQSNIQEQYDKLKDKLDQINELNQDLKNPEPIQNMSNDEKDIDKLMEEIQEELKQNNRKGGSQKQQQSGQQMKKLGQKMQQMQAGMEMEMMNENIDDLRNLLDNLVKISFKQEELIREFRKVRQVDPRFVELSQQQLKLKDDASVLEDSLLALSERVVQISSFITRELSEMNRNIDESVGHLKDRNRSKALGSQQYAMTSINNLALLLDDVLRQMQMAMSQAMGKPQKGQKGNESLPNLKQLQQQLSQRIQDLKDSGLKGRKLSEELAKMAAEQEMLRNELQKLQEQLAGQNDEAAGNLGKALKDMEQNEIDLVNKRLSQELIDRQEEIMTRLLNAEDAMREQDLDDEREGESAKQLANDLPKAFEDYLKARQKEIELLRSVPLDLNPFYKKEVNEYFRRISNPN